MCSGGYGIDCIYCDGSLSVWRSRSADHCSLHQYLPFFTDFHDKLVSSQSLTYSFGGGLGYNMWAVFAYYLASPLNLLITIVSSKHVMDFMAYLILLKIALTGGIFGWYLSQRWGR